jgi:hypothetical protein
MATNLSSISTSGFNLSPNFLPNVYTYKSIVSDYTKPVSILCNSTISGISIIINDISYNLNNSIIINLNQGINNINIGVSYYGNIENTYIIIIDAQNPIKSNLILLDNIISNGFTLIPQFSSEIKNYKSKITIVNLE